jgi:uncharacterized membrane protein YbaN (DUF454 family)
MPTRVLFGVIGWCAVGFAFAGALLPGLPTTVFVIAAAYCFSRSSRRFEVWLRENALLAPFLKRVTPNGGMPLSAKRAALIAMWTAIVVSSAVLASVHWAAVAVTIGLGVVGTLSILFAVPTAQPES